MLTYPAYVYSPEDKSFIRILDRLDLESYFEAREVKENTLTGWDSMGRRFTLAWNAHRHCPKPVLHGVDVNGLVQKVHSFLANNQGRTYRDDLFDHQHATSPSAMAGVLTRVSTHVLCN